MVQMKERFRIRLSAPPSSEWRRSAAEVIARETGGSAERVRERLGAPGTIASVNGKARAEELAELFRGAGLDVVVESDDVSFAWDAERDEASPDRSSSSPLPPSSASARAGGRTALGGALVCLGLAGALTFAGPLLTFIYGPLFVAAFVLGIVAIAQGRTAGGVTALVATLILAPLLTIGGTVGSIAALSGVFSSAFEEGREAALDASASEHPAGIPELPPIDPDTTAPDEEDPLAYQEHLEVYDFVATRIDTFLEENVAAVRFKVRNTGDQVVTRLEVTVFLRDENDRVIFERRLTPVSTSGFSSGEPLKPNYIFQMEEGRYYTLENAPDEWQTGNAILEISRIETE
jgi:hypothetical protein